MAITLGRFITLRFILIAFKSKNIKNQTMVLPLSSRHHKKAIQLTRVGTQLARVVLVFLENVYNYYDKYNPQLLV
ncbi:hypothetical protein V8V74_21955 [Niallia taxi]